MAESGKAQSCLVSIFVTWSRIQSQPRKSALARPTSLVQGCLAGQSFSGGVGKDLNAEAFIESSLEPVYEVWGFQVC